MMFADQTVEITNNIRVLVLINLSKEIIFCVQYKHAIELQSSNQLVSFQEHFGRMTYNCVSQNFVYDLLFSSFEKGKTLKQMDVDDRHSTMMTCSRALICVLNMKAKQNYVNVKYDGMERFAVLICLLNTKWTKQLI